MEELLFEILTPLNFTVRVTQAYWEIITTIKHPIMLNREEEVRETLAQPDEIRRSKSDRDVYLFIELEIKNVGSVPSQGDSTATDS